MAVYTMLVRIADVIIRFESERESDISSLGVLFKYHQVDIAQEINCIVILRRQASFRMPKDAKLQWKSKCQGIVEPKEQFGRRRVSVSAKMDTYGVASCYFSNERDEYYYGLMQDKTWICYRPSERKIEYVLHLPPLKRCGFVENEEANPLSAMPLLIHVVTTVHGLYLIHGAAVAVDGRASIFIGRSGSGKSTLCTDLARQKTTFMGDDIVLLYSKEGVPMVGSLLFPAKLYLDNTKEKREVDVPEEMHTDYCLKAPLEAVYLVRQSGEQESSVESCPSAELLQQLMDASNGMMMQYDKQLWLATMYSISETIPFFLLNFGNRSTLSASLLKTI